MAMLKKEIMYRNAADSLESEDLCCYLSDLNISRGWMAATAILLFQSVNLFDPGFYRDLRLCAGFAIIVPVCLLFLAYHRYYCRRKAKCSWRAEWIYLCFWVIITLGMMPFLATDAQIGRLPAHCILLGGALMIVPVFPVRETVGIFAVYMIINLVISIGLSAPPFYNLYILIICSIGCLFSCRTHQFYIGVIDKMREEARRDYMTRMLNRRGSRERTGALMELCLRHQRTFAFFMADIDHFKQFNDKYGHQQGDKALTAAAECMRSCFSRKTDVLCRYGGEEFLVVASVGSSDEALRLAEEARAAVEACHIETAYTEVSPYLTVSMGVAVYTPTGNHRHGLSVEQMVEAADRALYLAKNSGRNRVCLMSVEEEVLAQDAETKSDFIAE